MEPACSFAQMLATYLSTYLPVTRRCSQNTITAYRDAFTLFLQFMEQQHDTAPEKIGFTDFTSLNVTGYLDWLHTDRHCSAATTNQRLAALKSFFRYVQTQAPEQIAQAQQVLELKAAQTRQPSIDYLPVEAITVLLKHAQDRRLSDLALLTTLYDTAARVQEVCDLSIGDLHVDKPASLTLTGKGHKTRTVPLTPQVAQILTQHLKSLTDRDRSAPVFTNNAGKRLGRAGVAYILSQCAHTAHTERPDLVPEKISPHQLRHSKAMHLLENGVNLIYIRDILGHATIVTTEVYAKANPEMKREAIEAAAAKTLGPSRYDHVSQQDLLTWLRQII